MQTISPVCQNYAHRLTWITLILVSDAYSLSFAVVAVVCYISLMYSQKDNDDASI